MEKQAQRKKTETEDFKKSHPIGQSFHTGRWGWRRVNDCLDLSKCEFKTKKAAEIDRAKNFYKRIIS